MEGETPIPTVYPSASPAQRREPKDDSYHFHFLAALLLIVFFLAILIGLVALLVF